MRGHLTNVMFREQTIERVLQSTERECYKALKEDLLARLASTYLERMVDTYGGLVVGDNESKC